MPVKKIIGRIHLWLGLASGLLVFIIAITGCLYAFQKEIADLTQPYRFVKEQSLPLLPPSRLKEVGEETLPGKDIHAVLYAGRGKAAEVIYFAFQPSRYYYIAYLNPYTGEVLKVKDMDWDFFRIVLNGHYYLWLPPAIGQPIVASATLIFVIILISGLILWWPKNKGARKQRFTVKWNARWRRKNYDLHNVLGFYSSWVVIILAITGLVWGFEWFSESVYKLTGGEKSLVYTDPLSDTTQASSASSSALDRVWQKMQAEYPEAEIIEGHPPESATSPIAANANPDSDTYWKTEYRYFDQYSLKELPVEHIYGQLTDSNFADRLRRMNYDIHVGAILGFTGKLLAFFASLIVASLPVSGFYIWWGRRNKKGNKGGETLKSNSTSKGKKRSYQQPMYDKKLVS